jgi:hypothetical protein
MASVEKLVTFCLASAETALRFFVGISEGKQHGLRAILADLRFAGYTDLQHEVGITKQRSFVAGDRCSDFGVSCVGVACGGACTRFQGNGEACRQQLLHRFRHDRHTRFAWGCLTGYR